MYAFNYSRYWLQTHIKGGYGGLETFFLITGFSVHIWYQMKGLDELSWKIAKKNFFDPRRPSWRPKWPLKWVKIGFIPRNFSKKSINEILLLLWILVGWRVFKGKTESFFPISILNIFYRGVSVSILYLAIILHLRLF